MKKQIDLEDKKNYDSFTRKEINSSFLNDKSMDTAYKKTSDATLNSNLMNYMRDSRRDDLSRSLLRPQSSSNISFTNKAKPRSGSTSSSVLKSRKSLNNSRAEDWKKQGNKSFDENGKKKTII